MNNEVKIEIRAYRSLEFLRNPIALYISTTDYYPEGMPIGRTPPPRAVTFRDPEPIGSCCQWPCAARLSLAEAQLLMDSLWEAGIRPAAGSGSTGQIAAVQAHLEDMRSLAFAKTGVAKP